jgi:glycosyltransferase involved in cell wall biosynthesis
MHIFECNFDFSGFDDYLVKSGTAVYLWNLCREFRAAGHQVTGVTPAHGLLPELRRRHDIVSLDWQMVDKLPIRLDPVRWPGFPEQVTVPVEASAHRLQVDGMDVTLLAGGLLDQHGQTFHPPAALEGHDLSYLKPLVFQAVAARFLADTAEPGSVVHLHEPPDHYLVALTLAGRDLAVVSTVQTNLPVNTKVYGPLVRTLLAHLGGDPAVADGLADPPLDSPLQRAMRSYLPRTLLYRDCPERPGHDYVSVLGLVLRCVTALDYLSQGQLEHALTQAETPFQQLYEDLTVRRELLAAADRLFVGGCAIGDEWLALRRDDERRRQTLTGLGLDPALPTVYHNGRYSPQHKGLPELFRALQRVLDEGELCNVLLHVLAPLPPDDPELDQLVASHPDRVHARTGPMTPAELIDWVTASDVSVFPSKFEMDTFLMAMGEAMAGGAVPIATAQRGMRHFHHLVDLDDPTATGLAVPRSFQVDDPLLVDAVAAALRRMLTLVRTEPDRFEALRARSVATARQFTWKLAADRFLSAFAACLAGSPPVDPDARAVLAVVPDAWANGSSALAATVLLDAHHAAGGASVRCTAPGALRAEAVLAGDPAVVTPLDARPDGSFGGVVPLPDDGSAPYVALLVTFTGGRSAWVGAPVPSS